MNINNGIGARNPIDIEYRSEICPISGGNTAPPTTAITIIEAPFLVCGPRSFIPFEVILKSIAVPGASDCFVKNLNPKYLSGNLWIL